MNYADLQLTVERLITKFGASAFIRRASTASYDPTTGLVATSVASDEGCIAAVIDYEEKAIDGTLIQRGDQRALISCVGLNPPRIGDKLMWSDKLLSVVNPVAIAPGGINVLYDVQVRQ